VREKERERERERKQKRKLKQVLLSGSLKRFVNSVVASDIEISFFFNFLVWWCVISNVFLSPTPTHTHTHPPTPTHPNPHTHTPI
jgi:hypothetical protein